MMERALAILTVLAACGRQAPDSQPLAVQDAAVASDPHDPARARGPAARPLAPEEPPAPARPGVPHETPAAPLGLGVEEIRAATAVLAERARREGRASRVSLPVCQLLEREAIVARCTDVGAGFGDLDDRASFELPDPTVGRGVIYHYGSAAGFDDALQRFRSFERDFGTFVVANAEARLILAGAEQLSPESKERVRELVGALR